MTTNQYRNYKESRMKYRIFFDEFSPSPDHPWLVEVVHNRLFSRPTRRAVAWTRTHTEAIAYVNRHARKRTTP